GASTPRPYRDVRVLAADRDIGVGRVRDVEEGVLQLGFDAGKLRVDRGDLLAERGRARLEGGDVRPVRRSAGAHGLADLPARGVALPLEPVAVGQERPASGVERERGVDERRILALVDRALADRVGRLAGALCADAHVALPPLRDACAAAPARVPATPNARSWLRRRQA